jgi:hypothetical protein
VEVLICMVECTPESKHQLLYWQLSYDSAMYSIVSWRGSPGELCITISYLYMHTCINLLL